MIKNITYFNIDTYYILFSIVKTLTLVVPLLIAIAFMTLAERKVIAAVQKRKGPNVVGIFGILQPIADGVKLLVKETVLPKYANTVLFIIAPIYTFICSIMGWTIMPFSYGYAFMDIDSGLLYAFAVSSLGIYGLIMAGWSSFSKYASIAAKRSVAQMISYEVVIGLIVMSALIMSGSFNMTHIVMKQIYVFYIHPMFNLTVLFFICCLAETNRAPFDLPEAEAELVAGYNVEYSAMGFALFFLGEYGHMIVMCMFLNTIYVGGYLAPIAILEFIPGYIWIGIKTTIALTLFILFRAALPRYRYDHLMRLGWKSLLPFALVIVPFNGLVLYILDGLPSYTKIWISNPELFI